MAKRCQELPLPLFRFLNQVSHFSNCRRPVGSQPTISSSGPLHDDQRMHHAVFLALEDVAMPHVLGSLEAVIGLQTRAWSRSARHVKLHYDRGYFAGVHPDGFFPARFIGIRWPRSAWKWA